MTDPAETPDPTTPHAGSTDPGDEEAFHIPDDLALALTEFAAVEQRSRGEAICLILRDYLRAKGYLKGPPQVV
ncbi:ribbon-helix-helix domain-containing protein [Methylobacterium nonmethylotrophicum]|uniref:CopG family transcriptional regulator n=1 Tax=Methylobacterium nonmethylotrophicum TaxID=1141884 RepID=A0A4Z0NKW3_9HYPH|nr:ribbon-helix-helix domain-containing protein [Methylobacterium nonmethylotrophicum]TGD96289.1 CopG family transcriptional regulator [Methylobacterium nonmethylotrophicum]